MASPVQATTQIQASNGFRVTLRDALLVIGIAIQLATGIFAYGRLSATVDALKADVQDIKAVILEGRVKK